tara:strand:+ start:1324 stop:1482 length:159 start_codon:yes stop_codon:yes gene_type:complete
MVYTLAKGLGISPLEVYKMPSELFMDMLLIHTNVEAMKAKEIDKAVKKSGIR